MDSEIAATMAINYVAMGSVLDGTKEDGLRVLISIVRMC
jgi:hypothetical protein